MSELSSYDHCKQIKSYIRISPWPKNHLTPRKFCVIIYVHDSRITARGIISIIMAEFYAVCAWHRFKSSISYFAFYILLIRVLYFAFCLNLICGSALQNAARGINLNHPIRERRRCQKFMAKASARLGSGIICAHCSICIATMCFVALNTHVIICKQYICIATMYLYCTPQSKRR